MIHSHHISRAYAQARRDELIADASRVQALSRVRARVLPSPFQGRLVRGRLLLGRLVLRYLNRRGKAELDAATTPPS
jgi:hypothetical protein